MSLLSYISLRYARNAADDYHCDICGKYLGSQDVRWFLECRECAELVASLIREPELQATLEQLKEI